MRAGFMLAAALATALIPDLVLNVPGAGEAFAQAAAPGEQPGGVAPGVKPGSNQGAVQGAIQGVTGGINGAQNGLIDSDQAPRLREYILSEHPKSSRYDDPVRVGAVLPDHGVDYYDVPREYGATPYRVAVIAGDPVLVDPQTRAIKQVIK